MAKEWSSQLLSKATQTGGIEKLLSRGITEDHFEGKDKEVYIFLQDHVRKYKSTPTPQLIKEKFSTYDWDTIVEPLEYVIDQFIASVKRKEAVNSFQQLAKIIEKDEYEEISRIDEIFLEKAHDLTQVIPTSSVSRYSDMGQRIDTYKARQQEGFQAGIPYGIPLLDENTLGIHPHQFVVLSGWTGIGKSTQAIVFAINNYVAGHTPMFISLEMDEEELYRKFDAISVGLKQQALKAMTLPNADVERWEKFADKVEDAKNDIIILDVDFATADKVYAETSRWKPDVVYVDYIQLLLGGNKDSARWERIDYNARMLKAQAKQLRIPVVGLSQTNAEGEYEGAKLGNLGGSKSIGFHADVLLGLFQDQNMRDICKMEMTIGKNRMGPTGVTIPMYWSQYKPEFRAWKSEDAYEKTEI